ncbi:MAG: hypothetical protein PHW64_03390 [Sulfuricurvum sp.]|nr:hypothetical protein [Sulfuricurvum sp.]
MESLILCAVAAIWLTAKVSEMRMRSRQSLHETFKTLAIELIK